MLEARAAGPSACCALRYEAAPTAPKRISLKRGTRFLVANPFRPQYSARSVGTTAKEYRRKAGERLKQRLRAPTIIQPNGLSWNGATVARKWQFKLGRSTGDFTLCGPARTFILDDRCAR
jgi:hypothetical protein